MANAEADDYWDWIGPFNGGNFEPGFTPPIPAGDAAVVPDAYIHTGPDASTITPVNDLVPACGPVGAAR